MNINRKLVAAAITLSACVLSGCQSKGPRMRNINEAMAAGHRQLESLKTLGSASVEQLAECIHNASVVEDSLVSFSTKGDELLADTSLHTRIINLSDSLRQELTRLALSRQRSLADVIYIKTHSAPSLISDRKTLKQADRFFSKLDNNATLRDASATVKEYDRILSDSGYRHISSREIFKDYLKHEDICFRSLMRFLTVIPDSVSADLSARTAAICDAFYNVKGKSFAPLEEIAVYMTVRYNRRLLQNADACRSHLMGKKHLSPQQAETFSWMLLEPFMHIDGYSLSALSSSQQRQLADIAEDMPEMFDSIDKITGKKEGSGRKLLQNLSAFFLKRHIQNVI